MDVTSRTTQGDLMYPTIDRMLHSELVWAYAGMAILLAFFLTAMRATVTGQMTAFVIVTLVAMATAIFLVPAWALAYLGLEEDEAHEP